MNNSYMENILYILIGAFFIYLGWKALGLFHTTCTLANLSKQKVEIELKHLREKEALNARFDAIFKRKEMEKNT